MPGSGKTTLAKRLEGERQALRLCPDEWMNTMSVDSYDEAKRVAIEGLQWEIAMRVLELGVNVILEWGFWLRNQREGIRAWAVAQGVSAELCFLDVPKEELLRRLALRNSAQKPGVVNVGEEQLSLWWTFFEPPTADEFR